VVAAVTGNDGEPYKAAGEKLVQSEIAHTAAAVQGICLRLLTTRPHSRAELIDALCARGISEEVSKPVLDRLCEVGLVDDTAFAESVVYSGHHGRGLSRRVLRVELARRGVPDVIADQAVMSINPHAEEQRARELVRRKQRTSLTRNQRILARRLLGLLARKGYSDDLAWRVVGEEVGSGPWCEELAPESD
jgi:regulatory protein